MRRLLPLLLLLACPKAPAGGPPAPALEPLDCPPDAEELAPGTTCAHLLVPETRGSARTRTLRVAVAHLPPLGEPDPALPPLVFLQGGPGQPILHELAYVLDVLAPLRAGRSLWLMDGRGLGGSRPSLGCAVEALYSEEERRGPISYPDFVARCAAQQRADGADLSAYRSAALAADVDALRRAIGAPRVDLVGGSYGSRLALTVLRDFPDAVRAVVLDAPAPPEAELYAELPAAADEQLDRLLADCAADPACLEFLPEPAPTLEATVAALDAEPRSLAVFVQGVPRDLRLDGRALLQSLHGMLNHAALVPAVPAVLAQVASGDYGDLALAVQANASRSAAVAPVMHLAVQCAEELPFNLPAQAAAVADAHPRTASFVDLPDARRSCDVVDVPPAGPEEDAPVAAGHPVLLLVGAYDGKSRAAWAEAAAEHLPASRILRFPAGGHGALHTDCGAEAAAAFLGDPGGPEPPCVAELGPPRFVAEPGPVILDWARRRP